MKNFHNKKELIAEIAKKFSDYRDPEQRSTQARSVNKLAIDIYSSSEHFVYELIQNADDASDSVDEACVQLCFVEEYLIVSHDGRKFSDEDIKAVCGIGDSQKINSQKTTGYKGIGFKSVFSRSDWVYISSNGFSFCFDKNHPNWDDTYPWQMIPIWTDKDSLPNVVKKIIDQTDHTVVTVIKIKDLNTANDIKEKILKLFEKTQIILFLRHIKKIIIKSDLGADSELTIERRNEISNGVSKTSIWQNRKHESSWLIKEYVIEVSDKMRNSVINDESKRKLSETASVRICFAGKIEEDKLVTLESSQSSLFAYLPTSVSLGLPILVNGDFVLLASREQLSDNDWNKELISQSAYCLIKWLEELAQNNSTYRNQILAYLPSISDGWISNSFKRSFNERLKKALREISFIPDINNSLCKLSDLILDETELYTVIPEFINQYFKQVSRSNFKFVNPQLIDQKRLSSLSSSTGLKVFKTQDLKKLFEDKSAHAQFTPYICCEIIKFLYEKKLQDKPVIFKGINLEEMPFILSHKNTLSVPSKVFLPPHSIPEGIESLADHFDFVHDDILDWLKDNLSIRKWLCENLQLYEPTHKSIIQDIIAPKCSELTNDNQKSLSIIRYLFHQFKTNSSIFTDNICKQLSHSHLICKDGKLYNAECFLSDYYKPDFLFETEFDKVDFLRPEYFISDEYSEDIASRKDWNRFFNKLGVYDDLDFIIDIDHQKYTELNEEYPNYCKFVFDENIRFTNYAPYVNQHEIQNFSRIMFSKFFYSNLKLAKLVLNYIIPRLDEKSNEVPPTYYWVYSRRKSFEIIPYYLFMLEREACFPTSLGQYQRAEEVIITNQYSEIARNCLPILDLSQETCNWLLNNNLPFINSKLPFITELSIEHYLNILSYLAKNNENYSLKTLKENVTLIYSEIAPLLVNDNDLKKINAWRQTGQILALDGNFYDPSSLYCLPEKQFSINHDKNYFVALDHVNKAIISFLNHMNVQILSSEQISLQFENAIPDNSLKNRILNRIPIIASICANYTQDIDETFDFLWLNIHEYEFIRVSSLNLIILDKPHPVEDFGFNSNFIYFVGDWRSPKILYKIVEKLCSIWELEPNNFSHKIDFILRSSIDNGKEWLRENGYNTEILNKLFTKINDLNLFKNELFVNEIDFFVENDDLDLRSRKQRERDAETGRIGELFVFEQLENCYLDYYNKQDKLSFQLIHNDSGFSIGNTTVIWKNKSSESNSPYDFTIIHNGNHYFLEVKSTTLSESESDRIYLSPHEWAFFKKETKRNYFIARVFSVRQNPLIRMIRISSMELIVNKNAGIFAF
jgi:hypothetical protein